MSGEVEYSVARDPDRLGKTGGRPKGGRGAIPSVTRLLGKGLGKGWMKRAKATGGVRSGGGANRGYRQRVIVKALVVRHGRRTGSTKAGQAGGEGGRSKGGASLARHVRYLGRDGTSEKGERGEFYDRSVEGLNAGELTRAWDEPGAPDRHHFRLIISPEKGEQVDDLKAYVRNVMERVEQDLAGASKGTSAERSKDRLEWIAINHFNTDQPHAHVLIRGVTGPLIERAMGAHRTSSFEASREGANEASNDPAATRPDGVVTAHQVIDPTQARVLTLSRQTISHGIRHRAEEVATELLGERSLEEVRHAREREVGAERWTGLDRQIARQIELQNDLQDSSKAHPAMASDQARLQPSPPLRINIAPDRLQGVSAQKRGLLVRRLQTLQQYGLAIPTRGSAWQVEPEFRQRLIALGARGDIIKTLYGKLGGEAGRVVPFGLAERLAGRAPKPLHGVVVEHGVVDEMTLERYLVVRDGHGQDYYAKVREGDAYDRVQKGTTVALGIAAHERQQAIEELIRVAEASPARLYSTAAHGSALSRRTDLFPADRQHLLELTARQAEQLADRPDSGIQRSANDAATVFQIDVSALQRHAQRQAAVIDLRVLAGGREPSMRSPAAAKQGRSERFAPGPGRAARGRSRPRDELEDPELDR